MTATPFDQNLGTYGVPNDGNAICAAGDMLPVLMRKSRFRTGSLYKPTNALNKSLIGHFVKLLYSI